MTEDRKGLILWAFVKFITCHVTFGEVNAIRWEVDTSQPNIMLIAMVA